MTALPKDTQDAWSDRDGPVIVATVSANGQPNIIYANSVGLFAEDVLVVADNYLDKTRRNVLAGSRGSLLFRAKNGDAFQVQGRFSYHTDGPVFAYMKTWNPPQHPGRAAVALHVEAVYSGAKRLV